MVQNSFFYPESIEYFFNRAKDTRSENGQVFITLFGRLTRERIKTESRRVIRNTETAWVDLEEILWEQANVKTQQLPDGIHTYQISEGVFSELSDKAIVCPTELYYVIPVHKLRKFKKFH